MKKFEYIAVFFSLFFLMSTSVLGQKNHELDSVYNKWNFRLGPYFWFIGLEGEVVRPPEPPEVGTLPIEIPLRYRIDVSFKDIKSSIKLAALFSGIYRNKYFITQFNFTGIVLESEAITPYEYVLQNNIIKLSYYTGDISAGYRILKDKKIDLDVLLGLKLLYTKIGLSTNILGTWTTGGERDIFWIDPVLAINFKYRPFNRVEITSYGDYGSNFFDDDITFQYMLGVNYVISKYFFVSLGYQDHYLKLLNDDAIYNGRIKGLILRLGVQF